MRWPWSRHTHHVARLAQWDPAQHDELVKRLAETAAAQDNRLVIVLVQDESGAVGVSCWGSEACATNVEALGLVTHALEALKRRNADWWDE